MSTRTKLVVWYDGTDFCGWAAQPGQRSVQGTLKEAVRRVSGEDLEIVGASRTDSGAHARGQTCHFDTSVEAAHMWVRAMNDILPKDLRIMSSQKVENTFHSRFCALDRIYRYRILVGKQDPFRTRFVHESHHELDLTKMQAVASKLVGEHDFRAFTEELQPHIYNTTRTLFSVEVARKKDEVEIWIRGTAFLRGMMRRMSGAILEVGRGKRDIGDIDILLSDRRAELHWPVVLPAKGLTLMQVRYGRYPRDNRDKNASGNENDLDTGLE